MHIVYNVAIAAVTGCKEDLHDKIRHGIKEGLIVNRLARKAVGAFYGGMHKILLQFRSYAFRFAGMDVLMFGHAEELSLILENGLLLQALVIKILPVQDGYRIMACDPVFYHQGSDRCLGILGEQDVMPDAESDNDIEVGSCPV